MEPDDRYLVISSDCHAGAAIPTYRGYLESRYHADFDAWESAFVNPYSDLIDLESREYRRNFDSTIRQADLEADGIVGEVVFPNTIPPFFPSNTATLPDCTPDEYELRWAGIRAHNRWLADFCSELPDGAPESRNSCCTTSTTRWRRSAASRPTVSSAG